MYTAVSEEPAASIIQELRSQQVPSKHRFIYMWLFGTRYNFRVTSMKTSDPTELSLVHFESRTEEVIVLNDADSDTTVVFTV